MAGNGSGLKNSLKIDEIKKRLELAGVEIPKNINEYKNIDTKNLVFSWGMDSFRNAMRSKSHNSVSKYKNDINEIINELGVNCLNVNEYEKAKMKNLEIKCEFCDNVYLKSLVDLKKGERCPYCAKKDADEKKRTINIYDIAKSCRYDIIDKKGDILVCKCENNHVFERTVSNCKYNKKGCPICQKEKEYKKDFGIFETNDFKGLKEKAHFTCKICGKTQYTYFGNIRGGNMCRYCVRYNKSNGEKKIVELIRKYGGDIDIIENDRKIIYPQELDIYIPELKVAIEYNGFYWHSKLEKNYHKNKSIKCAKKGIRLIHIYDFESDRDINMVISSLFIKNNIYARKCTIDRIDQKTYKEFCEKNHLMGYRKASILYGLFYEDKLVQIASFSKSNYKKYDYEWIRGCPASYNRVVGGTSKLFKRFLNDYEPNNVLCYADFNKFDGRGYISAGFVLDGYTEPNKWVLHNGKVIKRNPNLYQEYKNDITLFGSGNMRFVYEKR